MPKWSEAYIGYIAGVLSVAALGWIFWRSQLPYEGEDEVESGESAS